MLGTNMRLLLRSESSQSSSVHMVKLGENRSGQKQAAAQLPAPPVFPVKTSKSREVQDIEIFTVKNKKTTPESVWKSSVQ